MDKVLVTPLSFGKSAPSLKETLESSVGEVIYNPLNRPLKAHELIELVHDIDGYISGLDEIDSSVIQSANRLKVIARYGVGVDRVDLETATRHGIVVTNTPGANSTSVAELTIGLILASARNICQANQSTKLGKWPRFTGVGLIGKTIGLIGLGCIGREVAKRLRGFECKILATDPNVSTDVASECGVQLVLLEELLSLSDFVSLHVPALPSTIGMVNKSFLQKMKPGAYLVNTSRGELIDESAVYSALVEGHLQHAALDCFSQEPPRVDYPLLQLPQVLITPHMGAHTDEAMYQMGRMAMQDCLAVLRGNRPQHIVNPEVYGG